MITIFTGAKTSISRPLELIFNECMSNGAFPSEWKKGERSAYSQEKRQCFENYHLVSLLSICDKILKRLLDPSKQAQVVILSRKVSKDSNPLLTFNQCSLSGYVTDQFGCYT